MYRTDPLTWTACVFSIATKDLIRSCPYTVGVYKTNATTTTRTRRNMQVAAKKGCLLNSQRDQERARCDGAPTTITEFAYYPSDNDSYIIEHKVEYACVFPQKNPFQNVIEEHVCGDEAICS